MHQFPPLAAALQFGALALLQLIPVRLILAPHSGRLDRTQYLILHPKSNGNGREWPLEYFVQLAQELQANHRIRCWISGSAAKGALLANSIWPDLLNALPSVSA